jgi:hypothetical protein
VKKERGPIALLAVRVWRVWRPRRTNRCERMRLKRKPVEKRTVALPTLSSVSFMLRLCDGLGVTLSGRHERLCDCCLLTIVLYHGHVHVVKPYQCRSDSTRARSVCCL